MAINIKDPVTDRLARELAREVNLPITSAIREALEIRLRIIKHARIASENRGISEFVERARSRAMIDQRTAEEILGYDAAGITT
jgi:antitoxin VapB